MNFKFALTSNQLFYFCTFLFCFNFLNANRSWVIFNDNHSIIYSYGANVFFHNLYSNETFKVVSNDYVNGRERNYFKDIAISPEDATIWAIGHVHDYGESLLKSVDGYCRKSETFFDKADSLFLSDNMKFLATLSNDNGRYYLKFKNLNNGHTFDLESLGDNTSLEDLRTIDMSNDGNVVVLHFYKGGHIWVWLPKQNKIFKQGFDIDTDYFNDFALSKNGQYLCSISGYGAELWNLSQQRLNTVFRWNNEQKTLKIHQCPPNGMGWVLENDIYCHSGPMFFTAPSTIDDSKYITEQHISTWGNVSRVAFSADSNLIYILVHMDGFIQKQSEYHLCIYDISSQKFTKYIEIPKINPVPNKIAPSPDGKILLILNFDGNITKIPLT